VGKGALGAVPTIFLIERLRADSVATLPDAFAPGGFAHPTAVTALHIREPRFAWQTGAVQCATASLISFGFRLMASR
jgi:hypothetical protein